MGSAGSHESFLFPLHHSKGSGLPPPDSMGKICTFPQGLRAGEQQFIPNPGTRDVVSHEADGDRPPGMSFLKPPGPLYNGTSATLCLWMREREPDVRHTVPVTGVSKPDKSLF